MHFLFLVQMQKNCIRLNFSNTRTENIDDGMKRLGSAISQFMETKGL